jgi:hypothetical protein
MNSLTEKSIESFCKTFCQNNNYCDCVEIGRGAHSIVFKVFKEKLGETICFKIIPQKDYKESPEEWNIISLLRKFILIVYQTIYSISKSNFIVNSYEKIIINDFVVIYMDYCKDGVFILIIFYIV